MNYAKAVLFVILIFAVIVSGCTQANAPPADDSQDGSNSQIEPQPETPTEEPASDIETEPEVGPTAPLPPEPEPEAPAEEPESTPPATPTEPIAEPPLEEPAANVKEFDVEAKKWEFVPSTITVNKGDTVKLHITSTDVGHGFALSAFGINKTLNPGVTVDVEFVADKAGSFPFFCNVFCGEGHGGMNGTLVVNE